MVDSVFWMLCAVEARFHWCLHEPRFQRPVLGFCGSFLGAIWYNSEIRWRQLEQQLWTLRESTAGGCTYLEIRFNYAETKIFLLQIHSSNSCLVWCMQMKYRNNSLFLTQVCLHLNLFIKNPAWVCDRNFYSQINISSFKTMAGCSLIHRLEYQNKVWESFPVLWLRLRCIIASTESSFDFVDLHNFKF